MAGRDRSGAEDPADRGIDRPEHLTAELDAKVAADRAGLAAMGARSFGRHAGLARVARIGAAVVRQQGTQQIGLAAAGAAFWLVISASPTAIAVVSLYGLAVEPTRVASDLGHLVDAAPGSLGSLIGDQLQHVAAADPAGLSLGIAVSIALAVWSASAGIYHLDTAIRHAYGLPRHRYVDARARSLVAASVLVVALGAIALATSAALAHQRGVIALVVGVPTILVGIVAALSALYRFAVDRPMPRRAVLPGATAAAMGMVVLLAGYGVYASASTRFTAVYGVFGAAVIGMMVTYLAVYATLLGAVLNVELSGGDRGASIGDDEAPPSG